MFTHRLLLLPLAFMCFFLSASSLFAQDYTFHTTKGAMPFTANASQFNSIDQLDNSEVYNQRFYRFVQFNALPSAAAQKNIADAGIVLLEYIPNNVYLASIPENIDFSLWENLNIRGLLPVSYPHKVGQRMQDQDYPAYALRGDAVMLSLRYYKDIAPATVKQELGAMSIVIEQSIDHGQLLIVQVPQDQLEQLIAKPFVRFVSLISEPGEAESEDGRNLHGANAIDGDFYGARNYDGTGINMAVNDDGFAGPHIDFQGRANQDEVAGDFVGTHGDMTVGIAVGAGNLDPLVRGMATGAHVFVRQYDSNMAGTLPLHQDSAVLVFSTSYSNGCNGGYTNTTLLMDQEVYNNPNLMQVFSAGNSNNNDCGYGGGDQWGNVTGGHKIAKNVITTANLDNVDVISGSSSRGPASDGRIKPDISAHGVAHLSTNSNNTYLPGGGTSAACPGIAGVFTQLNHAFKEMNGGTLAPSALLKLAMLITANDLGNEGPDFIFGWGKVNALRAVNLLEDVRYFSDTIGQAGNDTYIITIPAGVEQARIMVYWADVEGSTSAALALVNNLDCEVTDPSSGVHMPWILDHTPNATTLGLPATRGVDSINNMEQIAIDNPAAGAYTLTIAGTAIPFGAIEYYVAYEFLTNEVTVVHPQGGEGLLPGVANRVHWDAYGDSGPFTVEYTEDDGSTWNMIGTSGSNLDRMLDWNVPNTITGQARVRVTRGASVDESDANFTILERPQNLDVTGVCYGASSFHIIWDAVPGATAYDVFLLGQKYMDSVGSTANLNYDMVVADLNDEHWFSVRATGPNGLRSLRQVAVKFDGQGDCYVDCVSPDDAGVRSLDAPLNAISSCGGVTSTPVSVTLENLGTVAQSNIPVYYQLDNGTVITEAFAGPLAGGNTAAYTFSTVLNFPPQGTYTLRTWTGLVADNTPCNDTISETIVMQPPSAIAPYAEDMESGVFPPLQAYIENPDAAMTWVEANGIPGADGGNTNATVVNNFSYNAVGEEDFFYTIAIDMSNALTAELAFDVAYREYSATYTDQMRVDISDDCGATYSQIYYKDGPALATGGTSTSDWGPADASDWRTEVVPLASFIGGEIILRFVNINGYGNNLYLDNINVIVSTIGVDELEAAFNWTILPNPAQDNLTIALEEAVGQRMEVKLIGLDGKIVLSDQLSAGTQTTTLALHDVAPGIYFVHLQSADVSTVRKVVVVD
jgi:hypothetical protein